MGGADGHFSAAQKERLGWLNYNATPPITTVQNSGSYVIEPIETAGSGARGLKILKSVDPTTGAKTWYYLEYPQPIGYDFYISTHTWYPQNFLEGVIVYIATDGNGNSFHSLDMTPGSLSAFDGNDLTDSALIVCQSFTDAEAGVGVSNFRRSQYCLYVSL